MNTKIQNKICNYFFLLAFFVVIFCNSIIAQDNTGIKFFGLSIHPKGEKDNAFLMPNKLDKNAYFVMNLGGEIMYEKFVVKDILAIKVVQALYADCAERLGGFSHIGIRATIFNTGKHALFGGFGPTIVYRKNWMELNGYINQNRFKGDINDKWQYLFLWYGGEFEYKYSITEYLDLSISFIPGYPDLMSLAVGINLKIKNGDQHY